LHAAAERFEKDLPFQIAIVDLEDGRRLTARITGPAVTIGDAVKLVDAVRDDVREFVGATERSDDLTILALRWNGGSL